MIAFRHTGALAAAVVFAPAITQCNLWGNGDSPVPVIGPGGTLAVIPNQYTFPLTADSQGDGGGPAQDPSAIFLIQATDENGLGAESVPISVQVGGCTSFVFIVPTDAASNLPGPVGLEASSGADASPRYSLGAEAGPEAGLGDATSEASADASRVSVTVLNPYPSTAPPSEWGRIALASAGDDGCTTDSDSYLRCILSPTGTARFQVIARRPLVTTAGGLIPICVAPVGDTQQGHQIYAYVQIAQALQGGKIGLESEGDGGVAAASSQPAPSSCNQLIARCSDVARTLPVTIRLEDGTGALTTTSEVVDAHVTIDPALENTKLASDGSCMNASWERDVSFAPGVSTAPPLFVCTDAREGHYQLAASVPSQPGLGGTKTIDVAAQPASIAFASLPATEGGVSTLAATVFDCEGNAIGGVALSLDSTDPNVTVTQYASVTDSDGRLPFSFRSGDGGALALRAFLPSTHQTCIANGVGP